MKIFSENFPKSVFFLVGVVFTSNFSSTSRQDICPQKFAGASRQRTQKIGQLGKNLEGVHENLDGAGEILIQGTGF